MALERELKEEMKMLKEYMDKIEKLASQVALDHNCLLYDLEFKNRTLRVFIDKKNQTVSLDHCTQVSEDLGRLLDQEDLKDLIKTSYDLEVSSPGLEKILKKSWHFEQSLGETIKINMNSKYEGDRYFEGKLSYFKNNNIILEKEETTYTLPLEFVHKAQVVFHKKDHQKRQKKEDKL